MTAAQVLPLPSPLEQARQTLAELQAHEARELAALTEARKTEIATRDAFDRDAFGADVDSVQRAAALTARAERRHATAAEAVARARETVHRLELDETRARYQAAVRDLDDARASVASPVRRLVDLHRAAFGVVEELADRALADRLGLTREFLLSARPLTIDDVRATVRAALGEAERREDRTSINSWLDASPAPEWRDDVARAAHAQATAILNGDDT